MKQLLLALLLLIAPGASGQTTITASYTTNTVVFSTGLTYITFAIRNNNAFPVTITGLTTLQANLFENNSYTLWYSPTSLFGPPSVSSPIWTQVATSPSPITTTVIVQQTPFNCIGLIIPPSTTYRFALQGSKGTTVRGGVTPNIFSSGGVDLLVGDNASPGGQVGYFGWTNIGNSGLPYFFDGSITFAPAGAFTDLELNSIIKPATVCASPSSNLMARICNKSPQTVNFSAANANVSFSVAGPSTTINSSVPITSGSLPPCGCVDISLGGMNFSTSGSYAINASLSLTSVTDADPSNNQKQDTVINYKPMVSPQTDSICQFSNGMLFNGFTASNCQYRQRTSTTNALISSPLPADGNSDATAGLFAQSSLPGLPAGAIITGGRLLITNLNCLATGSMGNEARFTIYSPAAGPASPLLPGLAGSPLNFSVYNFDYAVDITATQLNAMYALIGAGGNFRIGYWETTDNLISAPDIQINAQSLTTQVSLIINYTIPPNVRWYSSPSSGSSFFTGSTMNPFAFPGSGLSNTNSTGTFVFFAACAADSSCRVPVFLTIKPSPAVVQDSLSACELVTGTAYGVFDLTSVSGVVSAGNPLASVSYYQDFNLSLPIANPAAYVSGTDFAYSNVSLNGCHSSDSVYLLVHPKPQFIANFVSAYTCEPGSIDVASLIDPFSVSPPGTDTLYFTDPALSISHPNPHMLTASDTVYMLFLTNTTPACSDTSEAILSIFPLNNFIVNQDTTFNYSNPGVVGCMNLLLSDGITDTLHSVNDCSRIAAIYDLPNGNSLGTTSICEEIDNGVQMHHGQPYVNRHYEITPANNDSAIVCLYYLDDDFQQYNNVAMTTWPNLPTIANPTLTNHFCIAQVDNGGLNTPGHTVVSIPYTAITSSYDTSTTIWTLCFKVDSFSQFYLHAQNPLNIPLPISLLTFTARAVNGKSILEWSAVEDPQCAYYEVERSADGEQFTALPGKIPAGMAAGNHQQGYHYEKIDAMPLPGENYYRLKQYDVDGAFHYSEIKKVTYAFDHAVQVFPNPVEDILNLAIWSPSAAVYEIRLCDAVGRQVHAMSLLLKEGKNLVSEHIDFLPDGHYFLNVRAEEGNVFSGAMLKVRH